jgi:hypothetical protein
MAAVELNFPRGMRALHLLKEADVGMVDTRFLRVTA